jgi:hypothetical protein
VYKLSRFVGLLAASLLLWSGTGWAAVAKTHLLRDAVVRGPSIFLSDLLPESSPVGVRALSQDILVGRSPQPGSLRVFSGDEIARVLSDGKLLNQVDAPEQIVVRRSGHIVTREEVAAAIRRTLGSNETFKNVQIPTEDIRFAAQVTTSAQDADLHVTRIELDRTLHEMKFWLVSRAEPALLPFMAVSDAGCAACDSAETAQSATGQATQRTVLSIGTAEGGEHGRPDLDSAGAGNGASAFVEAGKLARLHLVSGSEMQLYLSVISLERGIFGQTVRVRIQSTGKVLLAHVVGRNQLEAIL